MQTIKRDKDIYFESFGSSRVNLLSDEIISLRMETGISFPFVILKSIKAHPLSCSRASLTAYKSNLRVIESNKTPLLHNLSVSLHRKYKGYSISIICCEIGLDISSISMCSLSLDILIILFFVEYAIVTGNTYLL